MINIQDKIGKEYENCAIAVSKMTSKYNELLLNYANPNSETFSRKLGKEYAKNKLVKVPLDEVQDLDLLTFSIKNEISHVGLFYMNYCFHQIENGSIVAQEIETVLNSSKFNNVKIWRLKK